MVLLASAGHAPGVTTTALALALVWPRSVLLAECDPAGTAVLPGYLRATARDRGLVEWALRVAHGADPVTELVAQSFELGSSDRLVLPGIAEPAQARTLAASWEALAAAVSEAGRDVLVDAGRLGGAETPWPLVERADVVVLVTRSDLVDVAAAAPCLRAVRSVRASRSSVDHRCVALVVVGRGEYPSSHVAHTLSVPVLATLSWDARAARVLSHGAPPRRTFTRSALLREAALLAGTLHSRADHTRQAAVFDAPLRRFSRVKVGGGR